MSTAKIFNRYQMVANREIKFSSINKLASGLTVLWEREVPMKNMHWEANKNPNFLMLELASRSQILPMAIVVLSLGRGKGT